MISVICGMYLLLSLCMYFGFSIMFFKETNKGFYFITPKNYTRFQILLIIMFLPSYILLIITFLIIALINKIGTTKLWIWLNQKAFKDKK